MAKSDRDVAAETVGQLLFTRPCVFLFFGGWAAMLPLGIAACECAKSLDAPAPLVMLAYGAPPVLYYPALRIRSVWRVRRRRRKQSG